MPSIRSAKIIIDLPSISAHDSVSQTFQDIEGMTDITSPAIVHIGRPPNAPATVLIQAEVSAPGQIRINAINLRNIATPNPPPLEIFVKVEMP